MGDYRLYCTDESGRTELAEWFAAASDGEALSMARKMRPDAKQYEIWRKDRLVAKLGLDGKVETFRNWADS